DAQLFPIVLDQPGAHPELGEVVVPEYPDLQIAQMDVVDLEIRNVQTRGGQVISVPLQDVEKAVHRPVQFQAVDFRGDVPQGDDLELQFQVLIGGIGEFPPKADLLPPV